MQEKLSDVAAATENTHKTVLELISKEKRGKVLDAAAGAGALCFELRKLGFDVQGCDIHPANFKAHGITCDKVDLQKPMFYEDESFDYITSVETIEHVENPWHLLREFNRILKMDGKLYITTPNVHAFYQRIYFLFSKPFFSFYEDDYKYNNHVSPILFWNLERIIEATGFVIEKITFNRGFIPKIRIGKRNLKAPKNFFFGETLILVVKKVRRSSCGI